MTDFRPLFEQHPDPIWVVDREDLHFLEANQAAVDRYGYSREEFLKLKLSDLHPPSQIQRLRDSLARGEFVEIDLPGWKSSRKMSDPLEIDIRVRPVDFLGRRALIVVPADCGLRLELEQQLRQAKKMESVGMLAGGIAHDFNNLLTIISGYSQMLAIGMSKDHPDRTTVEQILKASDRAADLTRQLLAFSRRQTLQPKVLDLNHVIGNTARMLHRLIGEHIDLQIRRGDDLGSIHADPGQIEQVIMNLTVNARDAMKGGGSVMIETRNVELSGDYVGRHVAIRPGRYVMLAVTDTGSGMDEKTRSQVFDPFFTTKSEGHGTGLGLSTVYGIVKQSGGAIDLYSELGVGTSVKVYFPRIDERAVFEMPKSERQAAGGSETILVAEDEEAVRHLVQTTLERAGYRLMVAPSGVEALKMAKGYEGKIQLLITDVVMPKMSGTELAKRMAKLRPEVPVLYMSGYTDSSLQHTGSIENESGFLQKPFSPSVLTQKVREMLDAAAQANCNNARS